MAHEASDGMKFTNLPPMKAHQRSLDSKKGMGGGKDVLKMPGQGGGMMGGEESPEDTVAAHGPAVEVNVMHNHEAGEHKVHSKHGDGHEMHSDHASAEEAHDHAKALSMGEATEPNEGDGMDDAEYE